ncbi:MAG TPA: tetratricopeptide repeat protein [Allosphingosinicella sp.]|nr:tetratricopeptide repeat protein [Allosphingosinicella sp.]
MIDRIGRVKKLVLAAASIIAAPLLICPGTAVAAEWFEYGSYPVILTSAGAVPEADEKARAKKLSEQLRLAKKGDPNAAYFLATAYEIGWGTKKSPPDAFVWLNKAVALGNLDAKVRLGVVTYTGQLGPRQDKSRAASLFREAAQSGNQDGQFNLASLLFAGDGVTQSHAEAMDLLKQYLAANGRLSKESYFMLGTMNWLGNGVPRNMTEAERNLRLAAAAGYALSKKMLDEWQIQKPPSPPERATYGFFADLMGTSLRQLNGNFWFPVFRDGPDTLNWAGNMYHFNGPLAGTYTCPDAQGCTTMGSFKIVGSELFIMPSNGGAMIKYTYYPAGMVTRQDGTGADQTITVWMTDRGFNEPQVRQLAEKAATINAQVAAAQQQRAQAAQQQAEARAAQEEAQWQAEEDRKNAEKAAQWAPFVDQMRSFNDSLAAKLQAKQAGH